MSVHKPVLLKEVIEYLGPKPNQNFIDCTFGGGGHAREIFKKIAPDGKVLGIDLDEKSLEAMSNKHGDQSAELKAERLISIHDNFKNLKEIVKKNNFHDVSGILLDLGVSSMQLNNPEAGFGFDADTLDMRLDKSCGRTNGCLPSAAEIVNEYNIGELIKIFRDYGEERLAIPIAKKIEEERARQKIEAPPQLVEIIKSIYRKFYKRPSRSNPATKVFQALRIAVNDELNNLEAVLPQAAEILRPGGRLAVISFHSLEDRIVKEFFRREARDCVCPPEFPTCQCSHKKTLKIITKKPVLPSEVELAKNPRARSAKLRVGEKI